MKKLTISALIAMSVFQASANDPLSPIRNNEYLKNKDQVVADVQYDCKDYVDQVISVTPKKIIEKEGVDKFKQRSNYVCSYSIGASIGSKLFYESKDLSFNIDDYNSDYSEQDSLKTLYVSMGECTEKAKSGLLKDESDYIYCMTVGGVRDGFIHELSKK